MADLKFHIRTSPKTLKDLADLSGAVIDEKADGSIVLEDVSSLQEASDEHISFLDNVKYKEHFKATKAKACVVSPEMVEFAPKGIHLLISKNPYKSFALIARAFYPEQYPEASISDAAYVDETASFGAGCIIEAGAVIQKGVTLGKGVWIGSNAVIDKNVKLGDKCRIGANTTISHTIMGQNSRVYPGARIGQDGFGFAIDPAGHVKVPQLGRVIIGDNVEIGANTTIDRGAGPDTIIGDGAWIDNLVQIAHNVKVGRGCIIISQVGIAGSSIIEDYAVLAGQVGVAGHLTVGMGAQIAAQSGVMNNVPAGAKMMGSPAFPMKEHLRHLATLKKLASKK